MSAPPRRLGRERQDRMAGDLLDLLTTRGVLPAAPTGETAFPAAAFHAFRARVHAAFEVPYTSVTPMLARFLFGVALRRRPRNVWGLGTFAGNAVVWLSAHHVTGRTPGTTTAVDVAPEATALADANFARLGASSVHTRTADALACVPETADVDLLFIDVDDPVTRKAGYADCLRHYADHLAPGALVIAHDACEETFAADLRDYRAALGADPRIAGTVTIPLDPYGVEVSWTRAAAP
jgi:predicted O-methyltransferase YrrM